MTPFAGSTVPAEGVIHWLGELLNSSSLEAGLSQLLGWIEETVTVGRPRALWVWPEPRIAAIGVVGGSRYFDIRQRLFNEHCPSSTDLISWSVHEASDTSPNVVWLSTNLEHPESSPIAAVVVDHDAAHTLAREERLWLSTWIDWLIERDSRLRDAKLAAMAEFAAGAGHEINNPLGTILGRSQLLQRKEFDPERRRALQAIGGQALRIRDMISDMMVFARPPAARRKTVEVLPLIESILNRFDEELRHSRIRVDRKLPPLSAMVDPEQLQVVLIELIRNAIRAVGPEGCVGIRTRIRDWQGSRWLELDLYNNGPELTSAERIHAFDPFYSGRNAGRGLGFGLTKCWRILEQHQGRIGVYSTARYTVFRTLWPTN